MTMNKGLVALIIACLPISSFAASDLNQAATDACACLKEPYAQIEKVMGMVQEAQASGDVSKIMAMQGEMMGSLSATQTCFDGLTKKYPDIDQDEKLKKQVMEIAEKQCPNPASQFQK